ncbi:c-type cytochrome domain-containing protein, partial [Ferruginibacter sp.]
MKKLLSNKIVIIVLLLISAALIYFFAFPKDTIDFNTQVKPIFNKKCIACHGGVRQKADFSLLFRTEALAKTKSGKPAIIPGNASESELIKRITATDPDERMPYKHDALSKNEIDILKKWIDQGAEWGDHWAYVSVKQTALPGEVEQG